MPSREAPQDNNRPQRVRRGEPAPAIPQPKQGTRVPAPAVAQPQSQAPEDAWGTIMEMKGGGGGGDGTFNKMNTSFFLRDGEEANVIFMDEQPTIFFGHNIKCKSDAGKTFYRTEQCQKATQDYCILCDNPSPAIGKANRVIGFTIIDERGSWDSKASKLNGVPCGKLFLVPLYFAKQVKILKDDAETITDKIVKITKNGNYIANFKMRKLSSGGFDYELVNDEDIADIEIPEILSVYEALTDDDLIEFMDKFADTAKASARQAPASETPERSVGGFGGRR